jgi:hypothetical protein
MDTTHRAFILGEYMEWHDLAEWHKRESDKHQHPVHEPNNYTRGRLQQFQPNSPQIGGKTEHEHH